MAYTNIDDPSAYFQAKTYTGNGSNGYAITNDGNSNLQPDLWWVKNRDKAYDHNIYDSTRGTSLRLVSNGAQAEATATDRIASFDTNGFTLNGSVISNENNNPHVAWQWKANGGTTASNTDGTITSTVQANQDAGFSIVTYTGNGSSSQTVGHGLGVAPDFILVKSRNSVATTDANWIGYHKELTASYKIQLNKTVAAGTSGNWSSTSPTTSVFSILSGNGGTNASGGNFVAYCFAEKQGYSKFGKYVGNGSTNGTFVYTGFKPAFVMTKKRDQVSNWTIYDNKRNLFNVADKVLLPNASNADQTVINFDFVSNGFKCRNSDSENESGTTFIYMAFAENPFVTSTGIPTTAR